jgi:hypothetical protein
VIEIWGEDENPYASPTAGEWLCALKKSEFREKLVTED